MNSSRRAIKATGLDEKAKAMQNQAIDIHHHYVPKQLIEETKSYGKALGVDITEDKDSHALSFAGSKPHRCSPR